MKYKIPEGCKNVNIEQTDNRIVIEFEPGDTESKCPKCGSYDATMKTVGAINKIKQCNRCKTDFVYKENTFQSYIQEYIDIWPFENSKYDLKHYNETSWPFEFKIGLLKYICDDISIPTTVFTNVINNISCNMDYDIYINKQILNIVPRGFLQSIFK